jgi:hypothetical protein
VIDVPAVPTTRIASLNHHGTQARRVAISAIPPAGGPLCGTTLTGTRSFAALGRSSRFGRARPGAAHDSSRLPDRVEDLRQPEVDLPAFHVDTNHCTHLVTEPVDPSILSPRSKCARSTNR